MKTPFYLMLFKTQHAQSKKNREMMDEYHLSPGQPNTKAIKAQTAIKTPCIII